MSVRISATDWYDGGVDADEAVLIARAFAEHGVDAVDVSTGQVVKEERPAFGRSYQMPVRRPDPQRGRPASFDLAVIAVGALSSWDDVNSVILAGRADLCALGRAHLYDPQWTLHAAAEQDYRGPGVRWPAAVPGGQPPAAGRPHRRPQAAAAADPERAARHAPRPLAAARQPLRRDDASAAGAARRRRRRPGRGRRPDRAAGGHAPRSCSCRSRSETPGPFQLEEISRYDERGPAWYWNNIPTGEHTGTHFDAPVHWVTGQDGEDVSQVPAAAAGRARRRARLHRAGPPPTPTSCSRSSTSGPGSPSTARCRPAAGCSTAPAGTAARTTRRSSSTPTRPARTPPACPSSAPAGWPRRRRCIGVGVETVGTDAGAAHSFDPPFPCHSVPARRRQVRPDPAAEPRAAAADRGGARRRRRCRSSAGSGSPARVLALVER